MQIQAALILTGSGLALAWAATSAPEAPDALDHFAVVTLAAPEPVAVLLEDVEASPTDVAMQVAEEERTRVAVKRTPPADAVLVPTVPAAPQFTGPELVLPGGMLLDEKATDEELTSWHIGAPPESLVRLSVRLKNYEEFAGKHSATWGPDHEVLRPYHENLAAVMHESEWLDKALNERKKAPFIGTVPAMLGEDEDDFAKQYGFLNEEDFAVSAWQMEHAFLHERRRLADKRFENGDYDERLVPEIVT